MSSITKTAALMGLVALAAACARPEPEPVPIAPAPIVAEPTFSKF